MGLTSAPDSPESAWEVDNVANCLDFEEKDKKMEKLNMCSVKLGFAVFLLLVVPAALASPVAEAEAEADAEPGYGHGYGGYRGHRAGYGYARAYHVPHCQVTYDVVTEEQCATHSVPECATVVRQVPEQVCQTVEEQACHQEQQCSAHTETVVDTTTYEECEDVITKVCTNTQVTSQSHSSVVGQTVGVPAHGHPAVPVHHAHAGHAAVPAHAVPAHHAHAHAGHPGHALGKREADAGADAQLVGPANGHLVRSSPVAVSHVEPLCHEVPERKCHQVPVSSPRQVVTPHCVSVPVCVPVPRTACHTVARQVPEQVCHPKPVTECHRVARKVPRKVCAPAPVLAHPHRSHHTKPVHGK